MNELLAPALCFLAYGVCFNFARQSAAQVVDSKGVADNLLFFAVLAGKIAGLAFMVYGVWHFGWKGLVLVVIPAIAAMVYGFFTATLVSQIILRKLSALGLVVFGVLMFLATA